jgi:hypothetical protein
MNTIPTYPKTFPGNPLPPLAIPRFLGRVTPPATSRYARLSTIHTTYYYRDS